MSPFTLTKEKSMINPEQIRRISTRLFKFVGVPHEGLGADEQSILMTDCKLIEQIANDMERSQDGKD